MIVDSMTLREIHEELQEDFGSIINTLEHRKNQFRTLVLRSSRYPIRKSYECVSKERRNRYFVLFSALKRSDHSNPRVSFYSLYDRKEGQYCALLDLLSNRTYLFPPHFFTRYRERVVKDDNPKSSTDLIHLFVKKIWTDIVVYNTRRQAASFANSDSDFDEDASIIAMCSDGVMLGEYRDGVYLLKTIVTYAMLYFDQQEDFLDLYTDYCNRIYAEFPGPVADYILEQNPNHELYLQEADYIETLKEMLALEPPYPYIDDE